VLVCEFVGVVVCCFERVCALVRVCVVSVCVWVWWVVVWFVSEYVCLCLCVVLEITCNE
jgi:hypothetical protein